MHISDESEEEEEKEEKTNEPEERGALEKDENQMDGDEKIESPEKSNDDDDEEEDWNVCKIQNLTELILFFEPFIFLD